MLIRFFDVKKELFTLFREFIAVKSDFISFSWDFIAMRTVVVPYEDGRHFNEDGREGDEDGRHGNKPSKYPWDIWNAVRLRSQIFDSPGVKLYHFDGVSGFRQSKRMPFGTGCAPHFICCQTGRDNQ